jgi:hypothetical protein
MYISIYETFKTFYKKNNFMRLPSEITQEELDYINRRILDKEKNHIKKFDLKTPEQLLYQLFNRPTPVYSGRASVKAYIFLSERQIALPI